MISIVIARTPDQTASAFRDELHLLRDRDAGRGRWPARRPPPGRQSAAAGLAVEPGKNLFDPPIDEVPGAHVLRLLLAPDDLGVALVRQHLA